MERKIRILIAKPGLDGHDRGAKIIARALRDANMEVIYTGRRQTPQQIVATAIQEDVDAIGLSSLSGAHETLFGKVMVLLKEMGASDILVFGGGIIPKDDAESLKQQGIIDVFGPGARTDEIVRAIQDEISRRRRSRMIKRIDHIGIAVNSLDETVAAYKRVYGLQPTKIETLDSINVRIAFIPVGEVLIELLEPTARGAGRIGKFLEEQGEGLHHIAFRVEDIDGAVEKLKGINVPLRDQKPRDGGDESRIAFIEPEFTNNVLTELVERKREIGEE